RPKSGIAFVSEKPRHIPFFRTGAAGIGTSSLLLPLPALTRRLAWSAQPPEVERIGNPSYGGHERVPIRLRLVDVHLDTSGLSGLTSPRGPGFQATVNRSWIAPSRTSCSTLSRFA